MARLLLVPMLKGARGGAEQIFRPARAPRTAVACILRGGSSCATRGVRQPRLKAGERNAPSAGDFDARHADAAQCSSSTPFRRGTPGRLLVE